MPNDRRQLTECDKAAIHSVEPVIEAVENLQVVLRRRVESIRRSSEYVGPAADYEEAIKDSLMTEEREDLQEVLYVLEQGRRESRVVFRRLCTNASRSAYWLVSPFARRGSRCSIH